MDECKRHAVFIRPTKPVAEMSEDEIRAMAGRLYDELVYQRDHHDEIHPRDADN